MLEPDDAKKIAEVAGNSLIGASHDSKSFAGLPDTYWGYFARGHDSKGAFGVILAYSEDAGDIDALLGMYEDWAKKNKT